MSTPRLTSEVAAAIDRHITSTSTTLTRTLAVSVASLEEPRTAAPDLALRRLGFLIETLLGVAAGAVIGPVVSAIRRGFGSEVGFTFEHRLRESLLAIGPGGPLARAAPPTPAHSPFVSAHSARPLVNELGARLWLRLAQAGEEHRAVLSQLATAIPPERRAAFRATLEVLGADPLLAALWSEHLPLAWRFYAAALASESDPEPASPASSASATWRAWLRRVRGEAPPAARPARAHGDDCILAIVA